MELEAQAAPTLSLYALGQLRLVDARGSELLAGRRKELALLVYIARRSPNPVSRGEAAALLWGERPDSKARASLRQAVLRLRRAVGDALHVEGEALSLDGAAIALDLVSFEAALAAERYADAAALWRGEFLPAGEDLGAESYRIWVEQEREHARQRAGWAFERLTQDAMRRGDHRAAIGWAEQWTRWLPLNERAHSQLIQGLRLQGRIGEARAAHAAFVAQYRGALECDPSAQFLRIASELQNARDSRAGVTSLDAPRSGSAPMFGRDVAFGELVAAWEHARDRSASLVLVEGSEGIGKTRLCAELLRSLSVRGEEMLVLRAAAALVRRERPWSMLRDLLADIGEAPGLAGASPATLAELCALVPSLRDRFPRVGDARGDEWSIREAFIETLLVVSTEIPVVVFVDDVELADPESARLVLALGTRVEPAHVLLLITTTSTYGARELGLRVSHGRAPVIWRITLAALEVSEIELLLDSVVDLPSEERAALAKRLRDDADGNPLFMLDIVASLVDAGYLSGDEKSGWRASPSLAARPLPVPPRLRMAVRRRLGRLTSDARHVAEAAALVPGPLDSDDLVRITGLPQATVHAAIDELIAQRWATDTGSSGNRSAFALTHESVRRAVALSVEPERRAPLERAIEERQRSTVPHSRMRTRALVLGLPVLLVVLGIARFAASRVSSPPRIGEVTTTSLAAYRLYEEGVRSEYQDADAEAAMRLFRTALREDSTFAMAAYELAKLLPRPGEGWTWFERADRLAQHASDRERLLIRTDWAFERNDPAGLALSETLATRYPQEPVGWLAMAQARAWRGNFLSALPFLQRARAIDSAGRSAHGAATGGIDGSPRCVACAAMERTCDIYYLSDSIPAAVASATELVRLRPSAGAWSLLAYMLLASGADSTAMTANRQAEAVSGRVDPTATFLATSAIRAGDFRTADQVLEGALRARADTVAAPDVVWLHIASLRQQGRLAEALRESGALRASDDANNAGPTVAFDGSAVQALVLLEMGRAREAAALFDSIAIRSAPTGPLLHSRAARHRAWMLTHEATALAAAGDTAALPRLADSIEVLGAQSLYGRDRLLHHHVRGLLFDARGRPDLAAREFTQALYSPSLGYTRTNLELARTLVALQRPADAVAILRSALHGPLDASNMYVSRTELQEALAHAFDAAGVKDSARSYYARVGQAWRAGDPPFAARARLAMARVRLR